MITELLSQANIALFYAVNQIHPCDAYDKLMLAGTFFSDRSRFPFYLLLIIFSGYISVLRHKKSTSEMQAATLALWQNIVIVFVVAFMADAAFLTFAKHFFHHPRPFVALPLSSVRLIGMSLSEHDYYLSFPSGHASFATLVAMSIWPALGRIGKSFACLYVVWACWSRLALGVHFPADVVAGAATSACIVIAVRLMVLKYLKLPLVIKKS